MVTKTFRDELISLIGVALAFFAILVAIGKKEVFFKVKQDILDPWFWFFLVIVVLFSYWGLKQDDFSLRVGIHHGLTALIASYFSHLSLVFPAFFISTVVAYFSVKKFI